MQITTTDRQAACKLLATAIANFNCGKVDTAANNARQLIELLQLKQILKP